MATANSVARYLFTEGAGAVINDSVGSNNLDLDFNGNGNWLTGSGRGGVSSTQTMGSGSRTTHMTANLIDIATNGNIGSSFANATEMSVVMLVDPGAPGTLYGPNLFRLGVDGPAWGDVELVHGTGLTLQWGRNSDGGGDINFQNYTLLGGAENSPFVITIVIDSTQALLQDMARVWYNCTEIPQSVVQTATVLTPNISLGSVNSADRNMCWFNANDPGSSFPKNVEGNLYYGEVFTGLLTPTQVCSYATNILAGSDTDGGVAPSGARFSGKLKSWDTLTEVANLANIKMFASSDYGNAAENPAAHLFATDANGDYTTVVPECNPGELYWIQKESDDGTIQSLQLQMGLPI